MNMRYEFADRLQRLPPYLFVRLEEMTAKKRAEGIDIIDFGIGDPDLPTPDEIVEEIGYRHQGTAAKSIIKAFGDIHRNYIEYMEKNGPYLRAHS